jgi:hypothetical protein
VSRVPFEERHDDDDYHDHDHDNGGIHDAMHDATKSQAGAHPKAKMASAPGDNVIDIDIDAGASSAMLQPPPGNKQESPEDDRMSATHACHNIFAGSTELLPLVGAPATAM